MIHAIVFSILLNLSNNVLYFYDGIVLNKEQVLKDKRETSIYLVDDRSGILAQRFAKGVATWNVVRIANQQISSKMEGPAGKTSVTNAKTAIES
jgi:ACT domain-containing protein